MNNLRSNHKSAGSACSILLLSICATVPLESAWAHHSYAAYDMKRVMNVQGTLREFDWGAPHSSITVAYDDSAHKMQMVSATTGAPLSIVKQGFKISDFKAGTKVELKWYPNVNGAPGGEMASLKLPDGRTLRGYGFDQLGGNKPAKAKQ